MAKYAHLQAKGWFGAKNIIYPLRRLFPISTKWPGIVNIWTKWHIMFVLGQKGIFATKFIILVLLCGKTMKQLFVSNPLTMQWGPNELVLFNFETSDRIVFVWSLIFGPKPNLSGGSSSSYETFQIVETISSSPAWVRRLTRVKASHHACIVCKQVIIIITNITISILMEKGQKSLGYPTIPAPQCIGWRTISSHFF